MKRDKNGHGWKHAAACDGRAVCPFCGTEKGVQVVRRPNGSPIFLSVYRPIGKLEWKREVGRCARTIDLDRQRSIRWRGALVLPVRVLHAWPPRFEGVGRGGRMVVVPVMAYWRQRREEAAKRAAARREVAVVARRQPLVSGRQP